MRCGTDYHGGNFQLGCGSSFSWSTARRYQRQEAQAHPLSQLAVEETISRARNTTHVDTACAFCHTTPIRGIRYECINCARFHVCEACEPCIAETHSDAHVFRVCLTASGDGQAALAGDPAGRAGVAVVAGRA